MRPLCLWRFLFTIVSPPLFGIDSVGRPVASGQTLLPVVSPPRSGSVPRERGHPSFLNESVFPRTLFPNKGKRFSVKWGKSAPEKPFHLLVWEV
jgi:hypothetical protein